MNLKRQKTVVAGCLFCMAATGALGQDFRKTGNGIQANVCDMVVDIRFYSPQIVRVLKYPKGGAIAKESYSVVKEPESVSYQLSESPQRIMLSTSSLEVALDLATGKVSYADSSHKSLLTEKDYGTQFTPVSYGDTQTYLVRQAFRLDKDEALYGLGQLQEGRLNQRNQAVQLRNVNSKICIPYVYSPKGYGLLWDNYSPTTFTDNPMETAFDSQSGLCADYYFIYGDNADGVLKNMRELTGQVPMNALWTYGFWQSRERYKSQDELLGVVKKYRELGIPLDGSGLALMYEIREPEEGEKPPTYVEDNAVVEPYQSVTNMFSAPAYREINPNPFVAFFFFIFFGMMLADAVYGLILTVFTGIVLAKQRPPKGQASLIKIIFMGSISTIIWGVVFGSYFGFSAKDLGIWCWFNPIDEPMKMLYLSLAMGIFQMCFGLGINMVAMFRQKKPLDAISGTLSWYFMLIGLAMAFGSSLITAITMPAWVKTAGYVLLIVGVVLLMISGALHKKGAKKVSGALGSLYGIVNFFSDLMSYTRIFGLGLASAVIGMVFNEIGDVVMNLIPVKAIGIVAMAIVLLIGHVFNIGINTLGAYVHNSRLQFVEFFGKFYTGGGELFRPLGSEMKYYYISNQEVKK